MNFEIVDHGVQHISSFAGCGVAFTSFDHCVTGVGASSHDALEDAMDQLAEGDTGSVPLVEALETELAKADATLQVDTQGDGDAEEFCVHVSIRYSA